MRTLLLADDSITVQRVIALTFASEPIRIIAVADGQQAMEKLAAERPDIVLAGSTLPKVSGYDLAKFMRGKAELRKVPVLLLTGAFETVDEAQLAASGADGVLEKPVEPTLVISRVKELLGLKSDDTPATPGRLITPAEGATKKPPVTAPPRAAAPTRDTPSKPEPDSLDAAFDSLDQQLSGAPNAKPARNPSGPIGSSAGAADPRSPGRTPSTMSAGTGNPVFEVDDDWFGSAESKARADARAGRREDAEDLRDPLLQGTSPTADPPATPVFEVDEEWFAEDDQARAARQLADQQLAKEMGIHDVDLPEVPESLGLPAAAKDLDFDLGLEDFRRDAAKASPESPAVAAPEQDTPIKTVAPIAMEGEVPNAAAAGDLASVIASERVGRTPPPEIKVVTPEVTDEMLEQIASRVAERLSAGAFGAGLQASVAATMREAVRDVVAETSERIVRETVPAVVAAISERLIRDTAPAVIAEASERIVRETVPALAAETSARLVRDTVPGVVAEASERLIRETVPSVVAETSERLVRGTLSSVVSETSERLVRETAPAVVAETSDRLVRNGVDVVVTETAERIVRETARVAVTEAAERIVPESVRVIVAETAERVVRDSADVVVAETSERHVRDTVRAVVSETSERLVRDEIERIRSKNA